jgi:hypothetical protein
MKKIWIVFVLLSMVLTARAQVKHRNPSHRIQPPCHRYGLWYLPVVNSTIIDGIGVGFYAAPAEKNETLKINGLSIEADPLPLLLASWASMEILVRSPELIKQARLEKHDSTNMAIKRKNDSVIHENGLWARGKDSLLKVKINGISISGGITEEKTRMNGLAINAVWGIENQMNGLEITGFINHHYSFQGLLIAPVNNASKGRGVQIGIYNRCKEGHLIQIGLLNKIGKRTTPIINFSFKRKKQNIESHGLASIK